MILRRGWVLLGPRIRKYEKQKLAGMVWEVIARLLSADARVVKLPASSAAMNPANYNFSLRGLVDYQKCSVNKRSVRGTLQPSVERRATAQGWFATMSEETFADVV